MRYLGFFAVLAFVAAPALADWSDNFDSYANGTIYGHGGWTGWGGVAAVAGDVTDFISYSSPKSQRIETDTDSVHTYSGYTAGTWSYKAKVYVPTDFQSGGTPPDMGSYFILLNRYTTGGTDTRWSVQFAFDSTDHNIHADIGSSAEVTFPYVAGEWAQIEVKIYLQQDWTQVFYNGNLLDDPNVPNNPTLGGGYRWTTGVFGTDTGGLLNVAAVDLFANASSSIYYDDMSLTPIPEPLSIFVLLTAVLLRRR